MADGEGGGRKVLRGLLIALLSVVALILIVVFRSQVGDAARWMGDSVRDHVPNSTGGKAAVAVYIIVSILLGIMFSKAGHFTAYGIVMGLSPLLWFLFWEGFPPIGLNPSWTGSMGLDHLAPGSVILWAIVADVIITLVFVPLELRENMRRRAHRLSDDD